MLPVTIQSLCIYLPFAGVIYDETHFIADRGRIVGLGPKDQVWFLDYLLHLKCQIHPYRFRFERKLFFFSTREGQSLIYVLTFIYNITNYVSDLFKSNSFEAH